MTFFRCFSSLGISSTNSRLSNSCKALRARANLSSFSIHTPRIWQLSDYEKSSSYLKMWSAHDLRKIERNRISTSGWMLINWSLQFQITSQTWHRRLIRQRTAVINTRQRRQKRIPHRIDDESCKTFFSSGSMRTSHHRVTVRKTHYKNYAVSSMTLTSSLIQTIVLTFLSMCRREKPLSSYLVPSPKRSRP